jgi:radical SAM-linked protein
MTAMRDERLVFLGKLGAETPRPLAPREVTRPEDRRPKQPAQGPGVRLRLGFSKLGPVAFSAHLDLVRLFPRFFRQLRLPLFYSEGFSPKPVMTFGPALPVGVASLAEIVDVKLRARDVDEALLSDLVVRLNEAASPGIEFGGARLLGPGDRAVHRVIDEAVYVAGLPRSTLSTLGLASADAVLERVAARREGSLVVRRVVQGIGRDVDVGRTLIDAAPGEGGRALTRAGLAGDLFPISFSVWISQEGSARPTEVLEALIGTREPGAEPIHARVVRVGCFARRDAGRVSPLDLEALREPSREAAAAAP